MLTNLTIITAYIATGHPCANGHYPRVGYTCAASRSIVLGTRIYIEGVGYRVVEDRLAKKYDDRVDVFVATRKEALAFGKQFKHVTIYNNLALSGKRALATTTPFDKNTNKQ